MCLKPLQCGMVPTCSRERDDYGREDEEMREAQQEQGQDEVGAVHARRDSCLAVVSMMTMEGRMRR